ncbi:hypothetical protein BJ996_006324 [Streptomyces phaeogriseichromatogenes]|nr:hypothetical protein [Streptomyces murinus]
MAESVDERDDKGRHLVVRHGYHEPRRVTTPAGTVGVKAPRVNDERVDEATGERKRFSSGLSSRGRRCRRTRCGRTEAAASGRRSRWRRRRPARSSLAGGAWSLRFSLTVAAAGAAASEQLVLGVLSGEVGDAAGWWMAADAGVGSVVVVPVEPVGKRGLSFGVSGALRWDTRASWALVQMSQFTPNPEGPHLFKHPARVSPTSRDSTPRSGSISQSGHLPRKDSVPINPTCPSSTQRSQHQVSTGRVNTGDDVAF